MKINLFDYNKIIVYFSGGKDSLACILYLLSLGVDKSKIELWHHEIDGREGERLMDWPVTPAYCQAIADGLELPIYYSWKVGGFEREMLRENSLTAPTKFELPDGSIGQAGGLRGKPNTRRKFPQVSADLSKRYCSAYLKIDVASIAINNQKRFHHSKTLVISGERAEESPSRSNYQEFEPDRTDNRNGKNGRHVDRWRPIHKWQEAQVWDIIEQYKINSHPAYFLGFGRVSCLHCIFASPNQCASARVIDLDNFETIALYEMDFDYTIHQNESIIDRANRGQAYKMSDHYIKLAMSTVYNDSVFSQNWTLPKGAFGESCGPT